jgi:hypothetical protein
MPEEEEECLKCRSVGTTPYAAEEEKAVRLRESVTEREREREREVY